MALLTIAAIIVGFIALLVWIVFPRECKNALVAFANRKKYVVCYIKRPHTRFVDQYFVVPNTKPGGLTKIKKFGSYNLDDRFKAYDRKGTRPVFIVRQENSIPEKLNEEELKTWVNCFENKLPYKFIVEFKTPVKDDIIFQAKSVQTALDNNVAEFLFNRKDQIIYLILGVLILAFIILAIYNIYTLGKQNQILEYIANNIPQQVQVVK